MSKEPLSDEQRAAAECLDRNVLLCAGAGCGKTKTLVERYVNILKSGRADVRGIAAITFTEKAANELAGRIRKEIRELRDEAADEATREFWRRHLFALDAAEIGTIHGFCGSMLREFAVQAGAGSSFTVLDQHESDEMLDDAAREAVHEAVAERDGGAWRLLSDIELEPLCEMATAAVKKRETTAAYFRHLGAGADDMTALAGLMKESYAETLRRYIVEMVSGMPFEKASSVLKKATGPEGDAIEAKRAGFVEAHEGFLGARKEEAEDAFLRMYETTLGLRGGSTKKWGERLKDVKGALTALRELMEDVAKVIRAIRALDWEERARDTWDFLSLAKKAEERYEAAKREAGALDFEDMLIRARDLVAAHGDVAKALAKRWKFVLVDEFQDTDHVQDELVARLAAAGSNIFIVGDPEQSVYAFRGAEVEVFNRARDAFSGGAGSLYSLKGNYRAQPHIVAFANTLFARAMPAGSGLPEWRTPHTQLETRRAGHGRRVEVMCAHSSDDLYHARAIEAQAVARRISEITSSSSTLRVWERREDGSEAARMPARRDVAILLRSMGSVEIYERALKEAGVPYYTVAGSTFYIRQEVKDVVNLLRFVADPADTLSLAGALRSPLFAVSDDYIAQLSLSMPGGLADYLDGAEPPEGEGGDREAFLRAKALVGELRALEDRIGAREAVDRILDETGFAAAMSTLFAGDQRAANVLALRDSAAEFDASARGGLADFIASASEREKEEARESEAVTQSESGDVVRIMTVHAAKGLEWPIVAVADMGRGRRLRNDSVVIDRVLGICVSREGRDDPLMEIARWVGNDRDEAEEKRLFYVAATRARDHLLLTGSMAPRRHGEDGSGGKVVLAGWMRETLELLGIDRDAEGDHDYDTVTIEYSCPVKLHRGGAGRRPVMAQMRDEILAGGLQAGAPQAETGVLLSRIAPLPASAWAVDRLTATGIGDFCACPLKFEFAHLRGLPAAQVLEERDEARAPGHLVGSAVHAALEAVRRDETLEAALSRVIAADDAFAAGGEGLERSAREVLKAVERSEAFRRILAAGGEREASFAFLLDGALIEGKMDRMTERGVVDFKSDDVPAEEAREHAQRYRGQMDVYALAFARIKGRAPENVTLLYLRPGVEVAWPYGGALLGEAEDRVRKIIGEIRNGPPYRPRRRERCMCEYAALCEVICARRPSL